MSNQTKKEFRLPRKFAEKWLTALRSGEYRQTTGTLYNHDNKRYCCLGVACRVEYPLHYLKKSDGSFTGIILKDESFLKFDLKKIPNELKGHATENELVAKLTKMNDSGGKSFQEIAQWIENNVEFYD